MNLPIALMLDTKGPEIRLKNFKEGVVDIKQGQDFTLTTKDILGDETIVGISYEGLPHDLDIGGRVLIDDGLVEFRVKELTDTDTLMEALNDGVLKNHKGVNVPNVRISLPALTEKDIDDIIFGVKNDMDFIAPSFIRKAADVNDIRRIVEDNGGIKKEIT